MDHARVKALGAYYTPDDVVQTLVRWAVRSTQDRLLDPACGDGRFLVTHKNSVGVEEDPDAAAIVHSRAPGSLIHQGDFFRWAGKTVERFECAAGNPPFIRYQRFTGPVREQAIELCRRHGVRFTALTSSWAPFLVATASLLKSGGQLAFVVPAEIGHATYAIPLLAYLLDHFELVQVVAIREKLFPELSEDCWLLNCRGFGGKSSGVVLSKLESFHSMDQPPAAGELISVTAWVKWGCRLRPFLLAAATRDVYQAGSKSAACFRLGSVARIGIGYVTGGNDFFHLRPSLARGLGIPDRFLLPAVRNGRSLSGESITKKTVTDWRERDEPSFLLRLTGADSLPSTVRAYLDSPTGQNVRQGYKCRNRHPWYAVPDVQIPDAFLSYMSGESPLLVANAAGCAGTNSVHLVRLLGRTGVRRLQQLWRSQFAQLSCEIEGHPLGGGMLKMEPGEASRVLLRNGDFRTRHDRQSIEDGIHEMRRWRHYG